MPAAAAVTWTLSVDQADRLSPGGAQALLVLAALLDGDGIPAEVFAAPAARGYLAGDRAGRPVDRELARGVLAVLERSGLLATGPAGTPAVRVNPVVQAAIRAVTPEGMLDQAAKAAADALLEAWPEGEPGAWSARALPVLRHQPPAGHRRPAVEGRLASAAAAGRGEPGRAAPGWPAVAYWREVGTASDQVLGSNHSDTLAAGHRLAHAYLAAGGPRRPFRWFQWALADRGRALGPDHPSTIEARINLGRALVAADQFDDAVTVLGGAVGDYERVCGSDHAETLAAREELAAAEYTAGHMGRGDPAVPAHAGRPRARPGVPRAAAPCHPAEAGRRLPGRRPGSRKPLPSTRGSSPTTNAPLAADHPDTIAARGASAPPTTRPGGWLRRCSCTSRPAPVYEKVLGADHPDTLACLGTWRRAYYTRAG